MRFVEIVEIVEFVGEGVEITETRPARTSLTAGPRQLGRIVCDSLPTSAKPYTLKGPLSCGRGRKRFGDRRKKIEKNPCVALDVALSYGW
jgi:hypothetical protein